MSSDSLTWIRQSYMYIDDCNKHIEACMCDKWVNDGCKALSWASLISSWRYTDCSKLTVTCHFLKSQKLIKIYILRIYLQNTHSKNLFTEYPGASRTVNVSWSIAKTYLANVDYTTKCDVSLTTIQSCDDVNHVMTSLQFYTNQLFAERKKIVVYTVD